MQIDNNIKNELLALNNESLKGIIGSLAKCAGVNNGNIRISDKDLDKLREIIKNADDKDASDALKLIGEENAKKIINEYGKKSDHNERK